MIIAGLALLLPLVLAACGDEDDTNGDSDDPTATETTDQASTSTEGDSSSDGDDENTATEETAWDDTIVFGDGGFDSVMVHNRIVQYMLEHGYGYETENVLAENVTRVTGLIDNDIQVTMELWLDQTPAAIEAIDEGTIVDHGTNYGESIQGIFVPTYVIEGDEERGIEPMAPDLKSVEDMAEYKDLFEDPEEPGVGRFYNCIGGWECSRIMEAKLQAYDLDDDYAAFDPGSGPALATSLVSAYEQGEPWIGYYWAPTWIFSLLDLTQIEEPEYTDECWEEIFEGEEACAFPSVRVQIASSAEFAEQAPDAVEILQNYESTMDETNEILLYIYETEAEPEEAAIWWLEENEDTWTDWLTDEAAEGVREALDQGLELGD
ncbi:MAG: ABC transporter substrate-binding protein [Chloroflexota bacterium]